MIKPKRIFYSPSKNAINNKYKKITTSSLDTKSSIIKDKDNYLLSSQKKIDEEKEMITKRINTINKINETLLFFNSKKFNETSLRNNKVNNAYSYSSIFVDKLKDNQKLKEKNMYLKNLLNQLKNSNNIYINKNNKYQNKQLINNNKNLYFYNNLKKENSELNYINKKLKDEYSMLKLEENNNINIKKILLNKAEIENKIKTLNYSLNDFLELISTNSNKSESLNNTSPKNQENYNNPNNNNNNNNVHTLFFESQGKKDHLNQLRNNINDMEFTNGENLNMNNNNSVLKKKVENGSIDNATSEDFEIIIPLKQFEKTEYNKFRTHKKPEKINSEINSDNKLFFSGNINKNANSFKSIECNKPKKNKQIKTINNNKNKLPFKLNNLINHSLMNKSVKLFHLKNSRTSSNIKQNDVNLKGKEKNMKKNDIKQNEFTKKKFKK